MRKLILKKNEQGLLVLSSRSEQSIFSLYMFLGDGLELDRYVNFLNDPSRRIMNANISEVEKKGLQAIVTIYDAVIPNLDPFVTSIDNLVIILKEYVRLVSSGVEQIEIFLSNEDILIINAS